MGQRYRDTTDFLTARGMQPHRVEELNRRFQAVIAAMPTTLYGEPLVELTETESGVLREGGIDFDARVRRDPVAEAMVRFAALIETSLTTAEAAQRLGITPGQLRQKIARRALYSILLDRRRYLPRFQFDETGGLVANIQKVNAALPEDFHPLDVHDWYTTPDPDLYLGDDVGHPLSPLEWLRSGGTPSRVIEIARTL